MAKAYKDHIYALIVAGGGGTRLWPKSRNKSPKQFSRLFNKNTLTQITFQRLKSFLPIEKIFVVTVSKDYKNEIVKEVPEFVHKNIIVEPARKDTAPAHAIGAVYIQKKDPDAVIINAAADHLVKPVSGYKKTMLRAAKVAYETHSLIAVGITPTYPHTGLGYLKRGEKRGVEHSKAYYFREEHIEKPSLQVAEKYLKSGDYYWNANQYVWRADSFLGSLGKFEPKLLAIMQNISEAVGTHDEHAVINREYNRIPPKTTNGKSMSVDYAVSEREKDFLMMVADYDWTDIGDWKEVWENLNKDNYGNVIIDGEEEGGEIINIDTSDALIHKNGRLIAVIDVDNIVIVDTKDALLVCSKSRAQNVKQIVEELKKQNRKEYL